MGSPAPFDLDAPEGHELASAVPTSTSSDKQAVPDQPAAASSVWVGGGGVPCAQEMEEARVELTNSEETKVELVSRKAAEERRAAAEKEEKVP